MACAGSRTAGAERFPTRIFGVADGLARDSVSRIDRDSRGFLWFSTEEGLSLYDGSAFTTFGGRDGLPDEFVVGVVEDRRGDAWVATASGIARMATTISPREGSRERAFQPYPAPADLGRVRVVMPAEDGGVWCGGLWGLREFRLRGRRGDWTPVDLGTPPPGTAVNALARDSLGRLWIGTDSGLFVRSRDGAVRRWTAAGVNLEWTEALLLDDSNRLWIGTVQGVTIIDAAEPAAPVLTGYSPRSGLRYERVQAFFEDSRRRIWVGGFGGLARFDGSGGWKTWSVEDLGVPTAAGIYGFAEDLAGNLWLSTGRAGVIELIDDRMTLYSTADGLPGHGLLSITFPKTGGPCVSVVDANRGHALSCFDGRRFVTVEPDLGALNHAYTWGENQVAFMDHTGLWWIPTGRGVAVFPGAGPPEALARRPPARVVASRDGLAADEVFRLFEDSRGDVWIATIGKTNGLERWERASGRVVSYREEDGLPSRARVAASSLREDRSGNLWIGTHLGGLLRRRNGRFEIFTDGGSLLGQWISDLFVDSAGRLWAATSRTGLRRIDDPSAAVPRFVRYGKSDGLSSDTINTVNEDRFGRIYVGTGRGVDRFVPRGEGLADIEHFAPADGLPGNEINLTARGPDGRLWFGCGHGGITVFQPETPADPPPPVIRITSLSLDGRDVPLAPRGETTISDVTLDPGRHTVGVTYAALSFSAGRRPRYQIRVDRGTPGPWGEPRSSRTLTLAALSPGRYRLAARALAADGTPSAVPAVVELRILAPLWRRAWFLSLVAASLAMLLLAAHRSRLARAVELERVRLQISSDLHDDIGTSLSRVAILSEVIKQQSGGSAPMDDRLTEIAETARDVVASMSDVVWSNDPRRDDAGSLVARLCAFAADVMDGSAIAWRYSGPRALDRVPLRPESRRQIYLILKEALANAARHSGARSASMTVTIENHTFRAAVADDGRGFCAGESRSPLGGRGLGNMAERARTIGAILEVESAPGRGTRVSLDVPLA